MLPLTLYGSRTCEDSALTRARLRALGVRFADHNREDEPEIEPILARWNKGNLVTPTLVFGDDDLVIAEPTLEQLEEKLRAAGYEFDLPQAVEFGDELKNRRAPSFTLPASDGREVQLGKPRGRRTVLFFAHSSECRVCQGYARQLTARQTEFEEASAQLWLILPDKVELAVRWSREFARGRAVLADADSDHRVMEKYARYFAPLADVHDVFLLILDSYTAPRAGSFSVDAGGLIAPSEILAWLRVLECECAE